MKKLMVLFVALAVLAFGGVALATQSVSIRVSVESGKLYADVTADGRGNWADDPLEVYYLINDSSKKHMIKERTIKGERYAEHLYITDVKKGERIRVVIESLNSGDKISDSDSYPR